MKENSEDEQFDLFPQEDASSESNPEEVSDEGHDADVMEEAPEQQGDSAFETVRETLDQLKQRIQEQSKVLQGHGRHMQQALEIAASCQRQTSEYLNRTLERHLVNPAIRTVGTLAEELLRLSGMVLDTGKEVSGCPAIKPVIEAALVGQKVAEEELACVDIERICPSGGDEIDAARHEVYGTVDTDDGQLHGKIAELITPGLSFRGEVLRQAKVTVYRLKKPLHCDEEQKERDHE